MNEAATHFGWFWWTAAAVSFLLGSTPFGVLIARSKGVDIRAVGSGNPGATNVGRVLGKRFGIACFFLDACKGAVPVLLAGWLAGVLGSGAAEMNAAAAWGWLLVAISAILGHCFSPLLGFRGGKGVATGFGAVVSMWPVLTIPALVGFAIWAGVLLVTRTMSLASLAGAIVLPVMVFVMAVLPGTPSASLAGSIPFLVVTLAVAGLIVFRHRSNLAGLRAARRAADPNREG